MDLWVGGTLFYFLNQLEPGIKNEQVAKFYLAEIIIALEFIHAKNVIYRDLKPENVLIDIDGHIKISDFGLAKQLEHKYDMSTTFWGSPEYLAPEMIVGNKHNRTVDFYTLGWLMYELLIGIPPFYCESRQDMMKEIVVGTLYFPSEISDEAKELIRWLLNRDPFKRPLEISEIKNHKFFEDIHWGKFLKKEVTPPWLPTLYDWHYNPKFMDIPLSQVFGKDFEKNEMQERGSFYLELHPDSIMGDKISLPRIGDVESFVNQERPLDKIYSSTDWKNYLEDFDFEQDPEEELIIKEQIDWYKKQNRSTLKTNKDETKWSESDDSWDNDWNNIDESNKNSINAYQLKPSMISERMYSFTLENKSPRGNLTSLKQPFTRINDVKSVKRNLHSSFLTTKNTRMDTLAASVSSESINKMLEKNNIKRMKPPTPFSPKKKWKLKWLDQKRRNDENQPRNYKTYKKYLTGKARREK